MRAWPNAVSGRECADIVCAVARCFEPGRGGDGEGRGGASGRVATGMPTRTHARVLTWLAHPRGTHVTRRTRARTPTDVRMSELERVKVKVLVWGGVIRILIAGRTAVIAVSLQLLSLSLSARALCDDPIVINHGQTDSARAPSGGLNRSRSECTSRDIPLITQISRHGMTHAMGLALCAQSSRAFGYLRHHNS